MKMEETSRSNIGYSPRTQKRLAAFQKRRQTPSNQAKSRTSLVPLHNESPQDALGSDAITSVDTGVIGPAEHVGLPVPPTGTVVVDHSRHMTITNNYNNTTVEDHHVSTVVSTDDHSSHATETAPEVQVLYGANSRWMIVRWLGRLVFLLLGWKIFIFFLVGAWCTLRWLIMPFLPSLWVVCLSSTISSLPVLGRAILWLSPIVPTQTRTAPLSTTPILDPTRLTPALYAVAGSIILHMGNIGSHYPNVVAIVPPPDIQVQALKRVEAEIQKKLYDSIRETAVGLEMLQREQMTSPTAKAWYQPWLPSPHAAAHDRLERLHDEFSSALLNRQELSKILSQSESAMSTVLPTLKMEICSWSDTLSKLVDQSESLWRVHGKLEDAQARIKESRGELHRAHRHGSVLCKKIEWTWKTLRDKREEMDRGDVRWLESGLQQIDKMMDKEKVRNWVDMADGLLGRLVGEYLKKLSEMYFMA